MKGELLYVADSVLVWYVRAVWRRLSVFDYCSLEACELLAFNGGEIVTKE